jgi:hypothetical protein
MGKAAMHMKPDGLPARKIKFDIAHWAWARRIQARVLERALTRSGQTESARSISRLKQVELKGVKHKFGAPRGRLRVPGCPGFEKVQSGAEAEFGRW